MGFDLFSSENDVEEKKTCVRCVNSVNRKIVELLQPSSQFGIESNNKSNFVDVC